MVGCWVVYLVDCIVGILSWDGMVRIGGGGEMVGI